ncbi:unnamed protein product [Caenorhabditis auriculariae]|uniref:CYRIA/CYRIB Rac1 binding domain-containing protein n=1 Tax=Caenorhabditis auriculariae TaxID=2777116 RepID=A0A8S1HHW0_9PELO|nr:unnamed protein product [Caenorhabditis auriculariae]
MPSNGGSSDASCLEVIRAAIRSHTDNFPSKWVELFVDFENAVPTEAEKVLFDVADEVLVKCDRALLDLNSYSLGEVLLRQGAHDVQNKDMALEMLIQFEPYLVRMNSYLELSRLVEKLVPELLWELTSGPLPLEEQLISRQAIAKQLAQIINFSIEFDNARSKVPIMTNDLALYRRVCHVHGEYGQPDRTYSEEQLGEICAFISMFNPMHKSLQRSVENFIKQHPSMPLANTTDSFVTIVNVCRFMLTNKDTLDIMQRQTRLLCARVMVGLIVLFDHVSPNGAFCDSPINFRSVVALIRTHTSGEQMQNLIDILRYNTRSYRDGNIPRTTRQLLDGDL